MKILITGPTGLLGKALLRHLLIEGHELVALARSPSKVTELDPSRVYRWNGQDDPPPKAFSGIDAVIHLAGEGIANKPWTAEQKKKLSDSRVGSTRRLVRVISSLKVKPRVLISASAIGIYGETGDQAIDETAKPGKGFLSDLCHAWEEESLEAKKFGLKVGLLRLGLVLSREGGFLAKMAPVVLGNGKQWMSWIHVDDVVRFVSLALTWPDLDGAYNLVSPEPLTNRELTRVFSKKMGFPFCLAAPAFILKTLLGEMSTLLLGSQKVLPRRLTESGFKFSFANFQDSLNNLFGADTFLDNYHIANQFVPLSKEQVFPFFSRAENLEMITPPWLNFKITQKSAETVSKDVIIDYKLKIHGIPVKWRTLISEWEPSTQFVDDQLMGPYTKWHHVHRFETVTGGTLLRDEVTFQVPGWIFGKVFLTPWIRKDVQEIFSYRQKIISELQQSGKIK